MNKQQHLQNVGYLFGLGYCTLAASIANIDIAEGANKKRIEIPKRLVDDALKYLGLKNDPNRRRWVRGLVKGALEAKNMQDRMKLADKWGMKFIYRYASSREVVNFIRFVEGKWEKHTGINRKKIIKKSLKNPSMEVQQAIKKSTLSKKKQEQIAKKKQELEEKRQAEKHLKFFDEVNDFRDYLKEDLNPYVSFSGQTIIEDQSPENYETRYIINKFAKPKEINLNDFADGLYEEDWEGDYGEEIHAPIELLIKASKNTDWEKAKDPMAYVPIKEAYTTVMSNKRMIQEAKFTKKYSVGEDVPYLYLKTKGDASSLIDILREIKGIKLQFISTPKKQKSKQFTFTYEEDYIKAILGITTLIPTGDFGKRVVGEVYCKLIITVPNAVIKEFYGFKAFKIPDSAFNKFGRELVKRLK